MQKVMQASSGLGLRILTAGAAFLGVISVAQAAPITPAYDTFGELSEATFGGSGIPNDSVAITEIEDGANTITLGMASHGRYSDTLIGNDGAGTYYAYPGINTDGSPNGATWNFNFYADIEGGGTFADYQFDVLYDFDPGVSTDEGDHGILDLNQSLIASELLPGDFTSLESSQNLLFSYLGNDGLSFIDAPAGSFDPNATGEYSFALTASTANGQELGRAAINVNVVPEPGALTLFATGLLAVGFSVRRRYRSV